MANYCSTFRRSAHFASDPKSVQSALAGRTVPLFAAWARLTLSEPDLRARQITRVPQTLSRGSALWYEPKREGTPDPLLEVRACSESASSVLIEPECSAGEQDLLPIFLSVEHERIRCSVRPVPKEREHKILTGISVALAADQLAKKGVAAM